MERPRTSALLRIAAVAISTLVLIAFVSPPMTLAADSASPTAPTATPAQRTASTTGTAANVASPGETVPEAELTKDCWLLNSHLRDRISGAKETYLLSHCGVQQLDYSQTGGTYVPVAFDANAAPTVGNIQVNAPDALTNNNTTQSETSVAVNGNFVVAIWNDDLGGTFNTDYAFSSDGGVTWNDPEPTEFPSANGACCDGDVDSFSAGSSFGHFGAIYLGSAILFTKSADGGATWSPNVRASVGGSPDKSFMAIDNIPGSTTKDTIIAGWTDFAFFNGAITVVRSIDGGATWVNQQQLTNGTPSIQAVDLAAAGNGIWYAAWLDFEGSFPGTTRHIDVRKSVDNGVTWGPVVTAVPSFPRVANSPLCAGRPAIAGGPQRIQEGPHIVVNPVSKHVYLVTEQHGAGTDESDVVFARSIDGGATWSVNSKVNNDTSGRGNSFSTLAVTPDGSQLIISAHDKRLAADDLHQDRFIYRSLDDGLTWPMQDRVSDVTFGFAPTNPQFDPAVATCYHGDYDRVAADNQSAYVVWGDDRNIKVTPGFPSGRPDPDVFFQKFDLMTGPPTCGNGQLDPGEDCDGSLLGGATCIDLGFTGGTLGCTAACTFDTSACTGILCSEVTALQGRCDATGHLQTRILLVDSSHSGETVTFLVDGILNDVTVNGAMARVDLFSQAPGLHTAELVDPPGCQLPITINCP